MTMIKCNKSKCYYNVNGICTHRKIKLKYGKCLGYTRDSNKTFTVRDLVHFKSTCHKEQGKYKNNSYKVYR